MKDFKNLLRRVSPNDTDYGLHGLRFEGWNLAAAVDPELAEAHGGWKPGNASRYSRFNLTAVFNLSKHMVALQAVPPPVDRRMLDADEVVAAAAAEMTTTVTPATLSGRGPGSRRLTRRSTKTESMVSSSFRSFDPSVLLDGFEADS